MTDSATRQAAGAVCLAVVLVLIGVVAGGDVGQVLYGAGIIAGIAALAVLAVMLLRRR